MRPVFSLSRSYRTYLDAVMKKTFPAYSDALIFWRRTVKLVYVVTESESSLSGRISFIHRNTTTTTPTVIDNHFSSLPALCLLSFCRRSANSGHISTCFLVSLSGSFVSFGQSSVSLLFFSCLCGCVVHHSVFFFVSLDILFSFKVVSFCHFLVAVCLFFSSYLFGSPSVVGCCSFRAFLCVCGNLLFGNDD